MLKKIRKKIIIVVISGVVLSIAGCVIAKDNELSETEVSTVFDSSAPETFPKTETDSNTPGVELESDTEALTQVETAEETNNNVPVYAYVERPAISCESGFYTMGFYLEMTSQEGTKIYYSLDGTDPNENSILYTTAFRISKTKGDNPDATILKARAVSENGVWSETEVRTFFVSDEMDNRFSTTVISIIGDPKQLTDGPDGILYGSNSKLKGRETERAVYVTAWNKQKEVLFEQFSGVRVYGGASRDSAIKSLKLYARKSYDLFHGSFLTDLFQTPTADGTGVMDKYDRLVLRNGGNDFQFAYLRDELNQKLAAKAGFSDYEGTESAVIYLNGKYYGFYFIHESYCDDYFVEKYGKKEDKNGEFVILEGREQKKKGGDDEIRQSYCDEFNSAYKELSTCDLSLQENLNRLSAWMDIENYLDYFAFNIYINNNDWPQNNYKCYRYYPGEGESLGEGVYDGRWRFLLHDMDYSMNMYEQAEVMANYDNLKMILDSTSSRYAPLFANLMTVDIYREYFKNKIQEFADGALSENSIIGLLDQMLSDRSKEMNYYYKYLEGLRKKGDYSIWTNASHLNNFTELIRSFAKERSAYMIKFLEENLNGC